MVVFSIPYLFLISTAILIHLLLQDGSIEEWRNVFYLAAVIMVVFSIPYLFFGSGEEQPWNNEMSQTLENSANSHPKHDENQETKT
ncbi:putative inorganic phosphate cotransporter isoform X2 [Homalodisca vitripennis]|uniref:putative inorganic phosphate cotransporter isoform X2 n=1 Tax=Homalodisca vitripennis TaxID=197043 RepID=UPI001EEA5CE5|nr:putative inorganic phosphate cotransporter isoform X2 [Homalodisca vitripennis]